MAPQRPRLVEIALALILIVGALLLGAQAQPGAGPPVREPATAREGEPPAAAQAALPWIDVHMHLVGGRGQDWAGAASTAVSEMDRAGIALAIILPPPQIDGHPVIHDAADWAPALRRHPGRFAFLGGGAVLNRMIHRHTDPAGIGDAVKRDFAAAAEDILARGAAGFGEMASLHISFTSGHPYEFVPADHPLFLVLADVAARRDVPIDLHMDAVEGGMPTPLRFAREANPPTLPDTMASLRRLLAHNSKAKIVWAHGGSDPLGAMTPTAIGRLMDVHANLYVSLRIVGPQAPMQNKALVAGGLDPGWADVLTRHAERFVIGTDSFMVASSVRGSGPGITFAARNTPKLQATNQFLLLLPPDMARKVGRDNAARLYRVTTR